MRGEMICKIMLCAIIRNMNTYVKITSTVLCKLRIYCSIISFCWHFYKALLHSISSVIVDFKAKGDIKLN